jgi:ribosome biogenesis GTPase
METLYTYGFNNHFHTHHTSNTTPLIKDYKIGRIISIQGYKFHLFTASGELEAELSGKLLYGTEPELLPCVGDWVYYMDYDSLGYIIDVFPRVNTLSRKRPGKRTERQLLAANIDFGLIVQGLDGNFNLMRLDRYIVQIMSCGIEPVVILTKEDLITDRDYYLHEISRLERNCKVYFCSTISGVGLDNLLTDLFIPQKTYIIVGSSGVGKTSLVNALTNDLHLKTSTISESTGKGRHTTTTRDLFQLPNGSLVIDTPGMREFGVAMEDGEQQVGLFPAIEELAVKCRYADCTHLSESGCAVIIALNKGNLDPGIYNSYVKLKKEQRHFEIKLEDRKRYGKQFGKMVKEVKAFKKKYDM